VEAVAMGGGAGRTARKGAARLVEVMWEAWRERASEKRACASPKEGAGARVSRSRLAAALDARLAVRAGVRADDFLRHRLAHYAERLPVSLEALPVTFDVEGGEAVIRPRPPPRPARDGGRPETPAFARALAERDGPYAARELRDAEVALDALEARASAARGRLDALELELRADLGSGRLAGAGEVNATAEQLGRPPVPAAAPIHALRAFGAVLVVAEAWRFTAPLLAAAGVEPGRLDAALREAPLSAGLALGLAVAAAAAAFTFAGAALARAGAALGSGAEPGRRALQLAAAAAIALLVPGVAVAAAAPTRWAQLALVAVVPFAGAVLWRAAAALAARRAVAAEAALGWDRERAREAIERGRRDEVLARAAADVAEAEVERAAARRRLQQLHRRAVAAERTAALAGRAEAAWLERLAEGLAGALELDRYLYLRLSAERSHAPYERPARAPRLEPAVASERLGVAS
jgi:hypothetical protein